MAARFLIVSEDHLGEKAHDHAFDGGMTAQLVTTTAAAMQSLRETPVPVVLDIKVTEAEGFVSSLRADRELSGVPVVALVDSPMDAVFSEALGWGVDEVLPGECLSDLASVVRAMLRKDIHQRVEATRGTVVLAANSAADRRMRARPLSSAGFNVSFASSSDEVAGMLDTEHLAFVLADTEIFAPDTVKRIRSLITADPRKHPWVLVTSAAALPELLNGFRDLPVGFVNRNAAPEDALFIGNDILQARAADGRASPRLLHATVASFRSEGTVARHYGFTYNVSREGLYIRTLTPPPLGTRVWVELRPLAGEHIVHLECTVAWAKPFSLLGGATAPAGFGARITDATARDTERWRAGYGRLATVFTTVRPSAYVSLVPNIVGRAEG